MPDPTTPHERTYLPAMGRNALLPLYDPLTRVLGVASAHRHLVDQAGLEPGHRVLEVGCGTGNLVLLAKRTQPEATVVGLDPDPAALARARRKAGRADLDVRLDRGFADELPYPDASIDRVLSAFMFHHLPLPEKQQALAETRRVLTPGGALHLLDFSGPAPHSEGFLARLHGHLAPHARRHGLLRDNASDRVRALMVEARLTEAVETGRWRSVLGRYSTYRARP